MSFIERFNKRNKPRILCHFNHYFGDSSAFIGKSTAGNRTAREAIVRTAFDSVRKLPFKIDVKICGFENSSLLPIDVDLSLIDDPRYIVYASIQRMFYSLDQYDYFLNIEDDILLKANVVESVVAFNRTSQINEVFLPNRMECNADDSSYCVDLVAMPGWHDLKREFQGMQLDVAKNGHSGLFLLSREQMKYAEERVDLDLRKQFVGGFMASAFANVHAPFLLWRARSNLLAHHVVHLDRWMGSPVGDSPIQEGADLSPVGMDLSEAQGFVEGVIVEGVFCRIRGWALAPSGETLSIHTIKLGPYDLKDFRIEQVPRPDVVAVFPNAVSDSGFELVFSLLGLPDSAIECSSFSVLGHDGTTDVYVRGIGNVVWPTIVARKATINTPKIPDEPWMPDIVSHRLGELLQGASCYLEYGTGGTTVFANRIGVPHIIGVESDVNWLEAVRYKIRTNGQTGLLDLMHVNVGPTGDHGYPISETHWKSFFRYPLSPWIECSKGVNSPDVILIDGRFRVACFLATILNGAPGSRILFDDYFDRPYYQVVEQFAAIEQRHDRTAEFIIPSNVPREQVWLTLLTATSDPR